MSWEGKMCINCEFSHLSFNEGPCRICDEERSEWRSKGDDGETCSGCQHEGSFGIHCTACSRAKHHDNYTKKVQDD